MMRTLRMQELVSTTDGTEYSVAGASGTDVRLRNTTTGTSTVMSTIELAAVLPFPAIENDLGARALETLKKPNQTAVVAFAGHIRDIIGSESHIGSENSPYDPDQTTQEQRVQAKLLELRLQGTPSSRATLLRKVKAFRERNISGLVDRRSTRQYSATARIDPLVVEAMCDVLAKYHLGPTRTKSFVINKTTAALVLNPGLHQVNLPSPATLYRLVDALAGTDQDLTTSAKTRNSAANRPKRTMRTRLESIPGGETQIDSTPLDMMVKGPKGEPVRPVLTTLIDRATRSVISYTMRLDSAKAIDHVALLSLALVPVTEQPHRAIWRDYVVRNSPGYPFLDSDTHAALEAEHPYIVPRRIIMDNGKDFTADNFLATAERFGIDVTFSAPITPTDKGIVERGFLSVNTLFTQYLDSYLGRSPEHRGKTDQTNLMSIQTVTELFADWVLDVYQNRPHSNLPDGLNPGIKLSPNEKYAQLMAHVAEVYLPLTRADYIDMLPVIYRKISNVGVQNKHRHYDNADLHPLRNKKSDNVQHGRKWEVRYDPYNQFFVWVKGPDGIYIECATRDLQDAISPRFDQLINLTDTDRTTHAFVNGIGGRISNFDLATELDALTLDETDDDIALEDDAATEAEAEADTPIAPSALPAFNPDED